MLTFSKMHVIGNDYIYINCFQETVTDPEKLSIFLSDVRFGIGSDGLVLILPSEVADFRMRIFNADGSEAMMCGNATRCIGKYVYDMGMTDKTEISLETNSGIKYLTLYPGADNKIDDHTLQMRVWERGSGETFACGTGTCATVVAAVLNGYCKMEEEILVHLRGGDLRIIYHEDETVTMIGPATYVFEGKMEYPKL